MDVADPPIVQGTIRVQIDTSLALFNKINADLIVMPSGHEEHICVVRALNQRFDPGEEPRRPRNFRARFDHPPVAAPLRFLQSDSGALLAHDQVREHGARHVRSDSRQQLGGEDMADKGFGHQTAPQFLGYQRIFHHAAAKTARLFRQSRAQPS